MRFSIFVVFILLFSACRQEQISDDASHVLISSKHTYGEIDRHFAQKNGFQYPLNIIGTIDIPQDGRYCTASLISGKHIITASHCITDEINHKLLRGSYKFKLKVKKNGRFSESYNITKFYYRNLGFLRRVSDAKNHWAILELDRDTGLSNYAFKINYPGHEKYNIDHFTNQAVNIAGYSTSLNGDSDALTYSKGSCDILEHRYESYVGLHDCDAGPGDSGAPIYKCYYNSSDQQVCVLSAIHVGAMAPKSSADGIWKIAEYDPDYSNFATMQKDFYWFMHMIPQKSDEYFKVQVENGSLFIKNNQ